MKSKGSKGSKALRNPAKNRGINGNGSNQKGGGGVGAHKGGSGPGSNKSY